LTRQATTAGELFDRFAETYDAGRRMLIPPFDAFYGIAVEVATLRLPTDRAAHILDIGAGTGLLTALVAAARPDATFTLLDASASMLELAPRRLGPVWRRCDTVIGDVLEVLPDGPFDAVVSALAIHHLSDAGKQRLFRSVHERLRPGGVFVNAEQVAGPTPSLDAIYGERWLAHTRGLGATDQDHAEAAVRMSMDLPAPVDSQCAWLRDAGYVDVDCFFKAWRFAVYGGWRAQESDRP
jgi:tRNA (cmo5U34)-methyltransferase